MRQDFNPEANKHPCMDCVYGGVWTEQQKPGGNYCEHPKIKHNLAFGKYHSQRRIPAWCPLKENAPSGAENTD